VRILPITITAVEQAELELRVGDDAAPRAYSAPYLERPGQPLALGDLEPAETFFGREVRRGWLRPLWAKSGQERSLS
jgi:hypothetical protein